MGPFKGEGDHRAEGFGRSSNQPAWTPRRPPSTPVISPQMGFFDSSDPDRQANIAFVLIFLGIVAVGGLTIWIFYGGAIQ